MYQFPYRTVKPPGRQRPGKGTSCTAAAGCAIIRYRVLRIEEQMYGCEELPAGQPVLCDVVLEGTDGACCTLPCPDKELTRLGIDEGSRVHLLPDGTLQKISEELL